MRTYKFELIICEGSNEFWDNLGPTDTGIEDVQADIEHILDNNGFPMDPGSNNRLILKEFKLTNEE